MNNLKSLDLNPSISFAKWQPGGNPVFLYSVGKDIAVMLHLALKAFYPAKPPFHFLHVDTTWKFREMIQFRDQRWQILVLI